MLFFFNDTATTEIYTLSLHDALPISRELRPALEPDGGGAAHRTAAPDWADARGTHRESRRRRDDRGVHPPPARPQDQAVRAGGGRAGPDPRRVRRRAYVRGPARGRVARLRERRGPRAARGGGPGRHPEEEGGW